MKSPRIFLRFPSFLFFLLLHLIVAPSSDAQDWDLIGPPGGAGGIMAVDSANGILYNAVGRTVYRSSDLGASWARLAVDVAPLDVPSIGSTIVWLLTHGGELYAMPQFGPISRFDAAGIRVDTLLQKFESPQMQQGGQSMTILRDTIYMRVLMGQIGSYPYFYSTDKGKSWIRDTMQTATSALTNDGTSLLAYGAHGLRRKVGPKSWESIGPDTTFTYQILFADGFAFLVNTGGLWRSDDGMESWSHVDGPTPDGETPPAMTVFRGRFYMAFNGAVYGMDLEDETIAPDDAMTTPLGAPKGFAVLNDRLFASFNAGGFRWDSDSNEWRRSDAGWWEQDANTIEQFGGLQLVGTNNGLFVKEEEAGDWTNFLAVPGPRINSVVEIGGDLIAHGDGDDGVYVLEQGAVDWSFRQISPETGFYSYNLAESDGNLFVSVYRKGLYRSTDRGVSWNSVYEESATTQFGSIAGAGSTVIATLGSTGTYISDDGGTNWRSISNAEFPDLWGNPRVAVGNGTIFLHGVGGTLFRSSNLGNDWERIGESLPPGKDPGNRIHLRLWELQALGDTVFATLTDTANIYRYFVSTDRGDSWEKLVTHQTWLPSSIAVDGSDLLVGTYGRGVLRTELRTISSVEERPRSTLTLTFDERSGVAEYSLESPDNVTLTLYSIDGRRVSDLDQGPREAGTFRSVVSLAGLVQGPYLLVLHTGKESIATVVNITGG